MALKFWAMRNTLTTAVVCLGLSMTGWAQSVRDGKILANPTSRDLKAAELSLRVYNRQGQVQRTLGNGQEMQADGTWGPDGSIYYVRMDPDISNGEIWRLSADGLERKLLFSAPGCLALGPVASPDGRSVAFYTVETGGKDDLPRVWVMNSDGSEARAITPPGTAFPSWHPDSRSLICVAGVDKPNEARVQLQSYDLEGKLRQVIFSHDQPILSPAWSPDGANIAFCQTGPEPKACHVCVIKADGSEFRKLTRGAVTELGCQFDSLGRVYFNRFSPAKNEIWSCEKDGSGARKVVDSASFQGGMMLIWLAGRESSSPAPTK